MKLRIAWIADPEDASTYSAKEARILLRALARRSDIVALWFAVGSGEPPHFWNGIRVFPIPQETLNYSGFLQTLIGQQRPHIIVSSIAKERFRAGFEHLAGSEIPWIHRLQPGEPTSGAIARKARGNTESHSDGTGRLAAVMPEFISGLDSIEGGEETAAVLNRLEEALAARTPTWVSSAGPFATYLVMRQQLFCNSSLAHVMFELTNALLELGVPTVAQEEHPEFAKRYIHREEISLRNAVPEKCERIVKSTAKQYDPENAITVHFSMFSPATKGARFGTFPSLGRREVLYTTGNHTMTREGVRKLDYFEKILAPTHHVLRPYLEAGLDRMRGAVIPHGIDPEVFSPNAQPIRYPTTKNFKFLQTSFPWVTEKGFDLTLQAFCRAFSPNDDVALILRTPRIRDANERRSTFGRLEGLVRESRMGGNAPEILLVEQDVDLGHRGGVYTGADCYLFPLRAEGFGMTILEAMACGLPVIATPWSGPADFLSPQWAYTLRHSNPIPERARDGTLLRYHVEPDIEQLVWLMRRVYQNPEEAKALGLCRELDYAGWREFSL